MQASLDSRTTRCGPPRAARALRLACLAALVSLGASACSVRRFAAGQLGDALAEGGASFARDDDPEIGRAHV